MPFPMFAMSKHAPEYKAVSVPGVKSQTPDRVHTYGLPPPEMKTSSPVLPYVGQHSLLNPSTYNNQCSTSRPLQNSSLTSLLDDPNATNMESQPRQYPRTAVTPDEKSVLTSLGSPIRVVPPSRSRPQGMPVHVVSHAAPSGSPIGPPLLQRTYYSDPGTTLTSVRPAQFLYYHQVPAPDSRTPPISWTTRELVMRSPPLPRQRSARACKKCRKRKTKCCGAIPCTRCKNRGLDCEYDERAMLKGSSKPPMESQIIDLRPSSSSSSRTDESRPCSRGPYRHQPYPPTRSPIKHTNAPTPSLLIRASSAPELSATMSISQQAMAESLGMQHASVGRLANTNGWQSSRTTGGSLPLDFPAGPLEPWMEMSTMVESCPTAVGVPADNGPVCGWNSALLGDASDCSNTSRPNSACSGSSSNPPNESAVSDKSLPALVWPSKPSVDSEGSPLPSPLSPASSSSSLKDALRDIASERLTPSKLLANSAESAVPLITGYNVPHANDSQWIQTIASPSSILQSTQRITSVLCDVFSHGEYVCSPRKEDTYVSPSSSGDLKFEDFFNLSPDAKLSKTPGVGLSVPSAGVLKTPAKAGPTQDSLACLADYGSGSSFDPKTPRLAFASPFDSLTNILSPQLGHSLSFSDGMLAV